jgi:hypothetical protein
MLPAGILFPSCFLKAGYLTSSPSWNITIYLLCSASAGLYATWRAFLEERRNSAKERRRLQEAAASYIQVCHLSFITVLLSSLEPPLGHQFGSCYTHDTNPRPSNCFPRCRCITFSAIFFANIILRSIQARVRAAVAMRERLNTAKSQSRGGWWRTRLRALLFGVRLPQVGPFRRNV